LDVSDIAGDGDSVHVNGSAQPIPCCAQGIVRSHLAWRRVHGATDDDPLFVAEQRKVPGRPYARTRPVFLQRVLRRVTRETGRPVVTASGSVSGWLNRRHIHVSYLDPARYERA
jgi:hypothetical protein